MSSTNSVSKILKTTLIGLPAFYWEDTVETEKVKWQKPKEIRHNLRIKRIYWVWRKTHPLPWVCARMCLCTCKDTVIDKHLAGSWGCSSLPHLTLFVPHNTEHNVLHGVGALKRSAIGWLTLFALFCMILWKDLTDSGSWWDHGPGQLASSCLTLRVWLRKSRTLLPFPSPLPSRTTRFLLLADSINTALCLCTEANPPPPLWPTASLAQVI